jgi:hypothetical protein
VSIGGGINAANAVNNIILYTAANNTTLAGTERMRITSTGNVGIGTTLPTVKFHVSGNPNSKGVLGRMEGSSTLGALIQYDRGSSYNWTAGIGGANATAGIPASYFGISETTNTPRFVIAHTTGNVGIGVANPGRKLSVDGSIELTGSDMTLNTTSAAIRRGTAGQMFLDAPGDVTVTIDSNSNNTDRVFNVRKDTGSELFRIQENGNVGIGTTSPSSKLQVVGNVRGGSFGVQEDSVNPSNNTMTRVTSPAGATYDDQSNSASTGIISVILPVTGSNTMLSFTIRVFDYAQNESFDVHIAGYWYTGHNWTNMSTRIESESGVDRNFNIRFGRVTATNRGWVGIGETNTQWGYLKFSVINFQAAHVNDSFESWADDWDTAVLTSIADYTLATTRANSQVNNWKRNGADLYYGGSSGNVGIGLTNPADRLDLYDSDDNVGMYFHTATSGTGGGNGLRVGQNNANAFVWNYEATPLSLATGGTARLIINATGGIRFSTGYGAGTLVTDASGNITVSSGGGAGGPYLPVANPTFTGVLTGPSADLEFIKLTAANPGILMKETDVTDKNWDIQVNGGDLKFYEVNDARSVFSQKVTFQAGGNVGIGTTNPGYKLSVSGGIEAGGVVTYSKVAGSLDTTGYAVAGLTAANNGASAGFEFKCYGGTGKYQRISYSCYCDSTTWRPRKMIDEGSNTYDVVASADGTTITFTFKTRSGSQGYSPRVVIEATGHSINSTYA